MTELPISPVPSPLAHNLPFSTRRQFHPSRCSDPKHWISHVSTFPYTPSLIHQGILLMALSECIWGLHPLYNLHCTIQALFAFPLVHFPPKSLFSQRPGWFSYKVSQNKSCFCTKPSDGFHFTGRGANVLVLPAWPYITQDPNHPHLILLWPTHHSPSATLAKSPQPSHLCLLFTITWNVLWLN